MESNIFNALLYGGISLIDFIKKFLCTNIEQNYLWSLALLCGDGEGVIPFDSLWH